MRFRTIGIIAGLAVCLLSLSGLGSCGGGGKSGSSLIPDSLPIMRIGYTSNNGEGNPAPPLGFVIFVTIEDKNSAVDLYKAVCAGNGGLSQCIPDFQDRTICGLTRMQIPPEPYGEASVPNSAASFIPNYAALGNPDPFNYNEDLPGLYITADCYDGGPTVNIANFFQQVDIFPDLESGGRFITASWYLEPGQFKGGGMSTQFVLDGLHVGGSGFPCTATDDSTCNSQDCVQNVAPPYDTVYTCRLTATLVTSDGDLVGPVTFDMQIDGSMTVGTMTTLDIMEKPSFPTFCPAAPFFFETVCPP